MKVYETHGNIIYDGVRDYDVNKWFNVNFLHNKYDEYNLLFFGNKLPNIEIIIIDTNKTALGSAVPDLIDTRTGNSVRYEPPENWDEKFHKVVITSIVIYNVKWKSRFHLENVLLHEMCHVYQVYVVQKQNPFEFDNESKVANGHGASFMKAAYLINLNDNNNKNYGFFVSTNKFNDEIQTNE